LKKAKENLRRIEEEVARGAYVSENRVPTFNEVAQAWLEFKKAEPPSFDLVGLRGAHQEPIFRVRGVQGKSGAADRWRRGG